MPVTINPIKFGTDGWRGLIAADFTFERLVQVAPLAAQVLARNYAHVSQNNLIIVGYDRRFMAENFAQATAEAVQNAGFDVLLADTFSPTPALSWEAHARSALGALVITASHNPAGYLGLKVKGAFGGSVTGEITQQIEALLEQENSFNRPPGTLTMFDPWVSYCQELQTKVNIAEIQGAIRGGKIEVFADVMHGAAATGFKRLLGLDIHELNGERDPLFGGGAPEPLPKYLADLFRTIREAAKTGGDTLRVGFVFDGDSDRIAAVDGQGNFLSSQILIPILIEHLAERKQFTGEIIKTVSGSDLIPRVADFYQIPLYETPIGYKYIAERMLSQNVLIGGEESGGIGYGTHIPERDALLSALYVLEAIVQSGKDLSTLYGELQAKTGFNFSYDRVDVHLASMEIRGKLLEKLETETPQTILGKAVTNCLAIDGYKFRLEDGSWLLIRFSGTEPVLRLYCEAPTLLDVKKTLDWAKDWADSVG
ncbi:phosphoglucomutase/phosphomannomutase family protein [Spirulina subsalsa]|uniref:phosphoglucomutase/phosphomannomutase family protein n=1 Tax=Spirulina subsalsa TaxID=54311 RepID=UPI0002F11FB3|nr:phosphoglucomutase/phosphomannomutase family protein [Spirulina subsalsa]